MSKALVLLLHEKSMPGSQVATRLEGLDFRVKVMADPGELVTRAREEKPMLVVADLMNHRGDVLAAVTALRADGETTHVPVIAYAGREDEKQRATALKAGVTVMGTDATLLLHLPQFVEAALHVD